MSVPYTPSRKCGYCFGVSNSIRITLSCSHRFHLDCIERWRERNENDSCPTCKWMGQRFYQCARCALSVHSHNDGFAVRCGCFYHKECLYRQIHQNLYNCSGCHEQFNAAVIHYMGKFSKQVTYVPIVNLNETE
ncbi:hypothetical protein AVEN_237942-1 [Araneus ventricosus]|uniref:RING-type domain-containing protein n=1 Tax=Araneus ventricosus TaxID=182803 RepID=A0A4Y2VB52_ARAVE|nr:hypothetical protein AVEN_237942-1 [Araneus ventricosus]